MLKKALKISLIISIFFALILIAGMLLTKCAKEKKVKEDTTVPDRVEYTTPKVISSNTIYKKASKKMKVKTPEKFSEKYQNTVKKLIEKYKKHKKYTFESPLLIMNPYGTNTTGLYIFFRHKFRINTKYMVAVKSINDNEKENKGNFNASLYTNTTGMPLAEQEGQIIGLIPGEKNYVSVYIYDENDKMIKKAGYIIDVPSSDITMKTIDAEYDRTVEQLSEGLYTVFGKKMNPNHVLFYDNKGMLRADLPANGTNPVNLGLFEDKLFYALDNKRFALVDRLGKIEKFFDIKGKLYGDMDLNPTVGRAVFLAKDKGRDAVFSVDLIKKNTKKIIDFNELFSSYYKNGGAKLKFTSIQLINDKDLLLSEKSTSSILQISNVFRNPKIKAVISGTNKLNAYAEAHYTKKGDFIDQNGQSTAYVDNVKKNQYSLVVFNVNKGGNDSFCYKYLVNEHEKTYTMENNIKFKQSSDGSARLNNGYLTAFLKDSFEEYNPDGNKLATFKLRGDSAYRVFKNDMKGSWFAK